MRGIRRMAAAAREEASTARFGLPRRAIIRTRSNQNTLVIVMIETPVGVANAYDIARVPGVDGVLIANTDLGNFSLSKPGSPEYEEMVKKIHDATLKAGKWLGATNPQYSSGRPDSKDMVFFQNGPSFDGYQPRAGRGPGGRADAAALLRSGEPWLGPVRDRPKGPSRQVTGKSARQESLCH
jgi:hypothetical protein